MKNLMESMKKRISIILLASVFSLTVNAQKFLSEEHIIYLSDIVAPAAIEAIDLDGDNDFDVIAALENKIFWYENTGSQTIFGSQQTIKILTANLKSLDIADLNGDGAMDIIVALDSAVIWFNNMGSGEFGSESVVDSFSQGLQVIFADDIDHDGDVDIISATRSDNKITWLENTDGQGKFDAKNLITTSVEFVQSLFTADIDGDGYKDVLSASAFDDKIAWYKNIDGTGTFAEQNVIDTTSDYARSVYATDLDGDGDLDVLSASAADDKIAWYENTDGLGNFSDQKIIARTADYPQYVYAEDVDGDGDMDVFSASFFDDKVAWYENLDGKGSFAEEKVISSIADQAGYVYAGDLDGDGDRDVITASCDFKISWHENTLPLRILKNPVSTFVKVDSTVALTAITNEFADNFQWQVNTGNGFVNLSSSEEYSGTDSDSLVINSFSESMSGNEYRCITSNDTDSLISDKALLAAAPGDQVMKADESCQALLPDFTNGLNYLQAPAPFEKISGNVKVTLQSSEETDQKVTFFVEVQDTSPPVFTSVPGTQVIEPNFEGEAYLPNYTAYVEVTDNCNLQQELTIEQTPPPFFSLTERITDVTFSATDNSGNKKEVKFKVILADIINPQITCPEDQVFNIDDGEAAYTVTGNSLDPIAVSDNDSVASITNNMNDTTTLEGAQFSEGTTTVTWIVSDTSGNETQCSFDVTVNDLTGVDELDHYGIKFYPNPSEGKFHYKSENENIESIRILDLRGKLLIEKKPVTGDGIIDLSEYQNGIYICKIHTTEKEFVIKVVKE